MYQKGTQCGFSVPLHHFTDLIFGLGFTTELCNIRRKVTGAQYIRNLLEGSSHVLTEVLSLHFSMMTEGNHEKKKELCQQVSWLRFELVIFQILLLPQPAQYKVLQEPITIL